jgi:hypothetical protein
MRNDLLPEDICILNAGGQPLTLSMVVWLIAAIEKGGSVAVYNVIVPEPDHGVLQNAETLAQLLYRAEKMNA